MFVFSILVRQDLGHSCARTCCTAQCPSARLGSWQTLDILYRAGFITTFLVVSITITSTPSLSGPPLVCLTLVLSPDIRILAAAPRSFWEITLQTFLKQLCSVLRCRTHSFRVRFQTFMHILVFGSYVVSKVCFKLQKPITVTHLDLLNIRKYVVRPVCYTQLLSTQIYSGLLISYYQQFSPAKIQKVRFGEENFSFLGFFFFFLTAQGFGFALVINTGLWFFYQ